MRLCEPRCISGSAPLNGQNKDNQRLELAAVAALHGWQVAEV
jgi:hypothetical protein